jgi:phosphatidylglycerophosphate synthase
MADKRSKTDRAIPMDQIRSLAQPPSTLSRRNAEHWLSGVYGRRVSIYFTWLAVRLGVSADTVTALMIVIGLIAAGLVAVQGWVGPVIGAVLMQFYLVLDCSDGEIARCTNTESPRGVYLDRLGHYAIDATIFSAFGIRASDWFASPGWAFAGFATAIVVVLIKVETDLVDVSRVRGGLGALPDAAPSIRGTAGSLRKAVDVLPFHRILGAVEASMLIAIVAIIDAGLGDLTATRILVTVFGVVAVVVFVGHLISILASDRLTRT